MGPKYTLRAPVATIYTYYDKIYTIPRIRARHTGRHARPASLGLYVMYAQAVQSVRHVERTDIQVFALTKQDGGI
jgi:hypothetical protein